MRTRAETRVRIAAALLFIGVAPGAGRAQPCEMGWTAGLGVPGVEGHSFVSVNDVAEFDDGYGSALYFVGSFDIAGQVPAWNVARWDGRSWTSIGADLDSAVWCARVFDLGNGPNLYVGGSFWFEHTTRREFNHVARWDGAAWHPLGPGIGTPCLDGVGALAVFDDGHGPKLYAGASTDLDVTTCDLVYRFEDDRWTPIGRFRGPLGAPLFVGSLEVFDDGSGPALYAGGLFAEVDGLVTRGGLARWDGVQWSVVGTTGVDFAVTDLEVYDDGRGEALFVAGNFTYCDDVETGPVARWDGASWSSVGDLPSSDTARAWAGQLVPFDEPTGRVLYATGEFNTIGGVTNGTMGRWDGTAWRGWRFDNQAGSPLVPGLLAADDGTGPTLYVSFNELERMVEGVVNWGIMRWRGEQFENIGAGQGFDAEPWAVAPGPNGSVVVGGIAIVVGRRPAGLIEKWDGDGWSPIAAPRGEGGSGIIYVLQSESTDRGYNLYAGGNLNRIDGVPVNDVARWDGTNWHAIGAGFSSAPGTASAVYGIVRHAFAGTNDLYAVGQFTHSGSTLVNHAARWDGFAWQPLGTGLSLNSPYYEPLAYWTVVHDDSTGPALYVGGSFTHAGGVLVNNIARWDGLRWSALGTGLVVDPGVAAVTWMCEHDDGTGNALYVAGGIGTIDGIPRRPYHPVRWRNQHWEVVGDPFPAGIVTLAVFDDGSGPKLYGSGGGQTRAAPDVWRLDGQTWTGVPGLEIAMMLATDDVHGRALWFGGFGLTAGGMASARIARYGCLPPPTRGDANCDGVVSVYDIDAFVLALTDRAAYEQRFGCDRRNADLNGDGLVNNFDIDILVELILGC